MRNGRTIIWLVAAAMLVGGVVVAQQSRKTATAEFGGELFEWAMDTNLFTLSGGAWLNVKADQVAKMTASAMTIKLNEKLNLVESLTATGPVKIDMLTAKGEKGVQRKIIASCAEKGTYQEAEQLIEMIGDVEADVTTLPAGNVEAAHLCGDKISFDLKTNKVTVTQAKMTVTTETGAGKGEQ